MVESRSIGARLVHGKAGNEGAGWGPTSWAKVVGTEPPCIYLQPMLSNAPIRIGSVRLNLLQKCKVKGHVTAQPQ